MLRKLMYRVMYWRGRPRWDTSQTPPEVIEAIESGGLTPGHALDLGCGTGTNVIYLAQHGWRATGLDFVPDAIDQARHKASAAGVYDQTVFHVADVTRLAEMDLPSTNFALDMGCFHSLNPAGREGYIEGLTKLMLPGGRYMLFAFGPCQRLGMSMGITPEDVEGMFAPAFEVTRKEEGTSPGGAYWYWMTRV